MNAFPAFIPLYGARIVVVGDGEAAEAKARLVAGSVAEVVRAPASAAHDPLTYAGARLAFVAVEDEETQRRALEAAHAAGALVNVVDRQELGDFHAPAIVDRSPVIAAIGTGGAAPMFATLLRASLEARWPEGLGRVAALSGELQRQVREALPEAAARRAYWRRVLRGPAGRAAESGDMEAARRLALDALDDRPAPGRVVILPLPSRPELLTLAALRALGAADRIVAEAGTAAEVLAYARRDAPRVVAADPGQLAAWAQGGEMVLVVGPADADGLARDLAARGVETGRAPVASA